MSSIRERARDFGVETLADVETLTLLVGEKSAGTLLANFNHMGEILGQDAVTLSRLIGPAATLKLKVVQNIAHRALLQPVRRNVISSWSSLSAYLKFDMAHRQREQFRVLFLDKRNALIRDEVMHEGTVDHAPVYPREVVRRALELNASAIILVHNHPSGDPTPSSADVEITRQIVNAAKALRIGIHDHVVVGSDGVASFKALGLL